MSSEHAERLSALESVDSFHTERYRYAAQFAKGKRVLDTACGIGYGSSLLKRGGAANVLGVDVSAEAIDYATQHYAGDGISFESADCFAIEGTYDLVVSIETIEHLQKGDLWPGRIASLLRSPGTAIISTPCRIGGSLDDTPANPFHVREYSPDEFTALLEEEFDEVNVLFQGFRIPEVQGTAVTRMVKRLFTYLQLRKSVKEESKPVLTLGEWFERYDCKPTYMMAVCSVR